MALIPYTPNNAFPDLDGTGGQGPLELPQDGDVYLYETHYVGAGGTANKHGLFGKIIDGLYYLRKRSFVLPPGPYVTNSPWLKVSGQASPAGVSIAQSTTTSQMIDLPSGTEISNFKVAINPGVHGGSYPPVDFPTLAMFRVNAATGASTTIATVVDAPASQVAYEAQHTLTVSFGPHIFIDRTTYLYYVVFTQENGTNAVDGIIQGGIVNII